jgi:hypothetical protein
MSFIRIDRDVLEKLSGPSNVSARTVLIELSLRADWESGIACMSLDQIAASAGWSGKQGKQKASRAIAKLVEVGALTLRGHGRKGSASSYEIMELSKSGVTNALPMRYPSRDECVTNDVTFRVTKDEAEKPCQDGVCEHVEESRVTNGVTHRVTNALPIPDECVTNALPLLEEEYIQEEDKTTRARVRAQSLDSVEKVDCIGPEGGRRCGRPATTMTDRCLACALITAYGKASRNPGPAGIWTQLERVMKRKGDKKWPGDDVVIDRAKKQRMSDMLSGVAFEYRKTLSNWLGESHYLDEPGEIGSTREGELPESHGSFLGGSEGIAAGIGNHDEEDDIDDIPF